jgi:outer membrane protein assembly factor BamB
LLWKVNLKNPIVSKPTVQMDRLLVRSSDDVLYVFNASTGEALWQFRQSDTKDSVRLSRLPSPLVLDKQEVIVGFGDGYLVSLSLEDGKPNWQMRLNEAKRFTDIAATPVYDNGILFVSAYDGFLYAIQKSDQKILWKVEAGGTRAVHLEDNYIYVPSSNGFVAALQKKDGQAIWKFPLNDAGGTPTTLLVTPDYTIFGASAKYLYVLHKTTGKLLYRFNAGSGSGFYGTFGLNTELNQFYALSFGGNLYAFELLPFK